jgi:pSer/pThr/pTyr-binding forkhead associated (FHA) protein/Mg-chelatase subunit ChlD
MAVIKRTVLIMQKNLYSRIAVFAFLCLFLSIAPGQDGGVAADPEPAATEPGITDADMDDGIPSVESGTSEILEKDVILVLDNSGSMKQNDPEFLTSRAVRQFIDGLDQSTRIAIIIFDQNVSLAVPFTGVTAASRDIILQSLEQINYRGLFTDSPNAVERAIYELKNNSREDTGKLIIFMTDGIVDTGNAENDLEKSRWLRDSLAPDAADAGIRIFGIAFTEDADFRLIQSLAQTTGGEYYRALRAEDLQTVFTRINTIINRIDTPPAEPQPQVSQPPSPQPVVIQVPARQRQEISKEERIRSVIIITAVVVLIVTLLAILVLLIRRRNYGTTAMIAGADAYLNDINGYTSQASYKLGAKPAMLGRVAGQEKDHLDYIVIPESTIGRRHSLIEYKDFAYWIIDQGSINGTFVNNKPIIGAVRLKHGDRIKLHKYEFEFAMPEMVDAGMTVISNTVLADNPPTATVHDASSEATRVKSDLSRTDSDTDSAVELDFDLTAGTEDAGEDSGDEEPTEIRGEPTPLKPETDIGSEDATYIPENDVTPPAKVIYKTEDETLMPGEFEFPDDDATIRKDEADISLENFIDLDDLDDDKKQ